MKTSKLLKQIVSTEYLLAAVLTAILFFSYAGFDWWWLFVLFPLIDLSAFGYLQDKKFGAFTYNLGHSLVGPAIVFILYALQIADWGLFVGLVWVFHIFVDRALGYGLKHSASPDHTHLGAVGKARKK